MNSGKDTAARIIQWLTRLRGIQGMPTTETYRPLQSFLELDENHRAGASGWRIKKWADALRRVAHVLLPQYELEYLYTDEFKNSVIEGWDYWTIMNYAADGKYRVENNYSLKQMTGRIFLQFLGTDAIRNNLHPNTWVKALMGEYYRKHQGDFQFNWSITNNWIITDTRFPNELEAVKKADGITIRIQRDTVVPKFQHESETALDNATFDFTINNNGSLEELTDNLKQILSRTIYGNNNQRTEEDHTSKRV